MNTATMTDIEAIAQNFRPVAGLCEDAPEITLPLDGETAQRLVEALWTSAAAVAKLGDGADGAPVHAVVLSGPRWDAICTIVRTVPKLLRQLDHVQTKYCTDTMQITRYGMRAESDLAAANEEIEQLRRIVKESSPRTVKMEITNIKDLAPAVNVEAIVRMPRTRRVVERDARGLVSAVVEEADE